MAGEVHDLPIMVKLREELKMQMKDLHCRYDCARKVLLKNRDIQRLPLKQAQGAL